MRQILNKNTTLIYKFKYLLQNSVKKLTIIKNINNTPFVLQNITIYQPRPQCSTAQSVFEGTEGLGTKMIIYDKLLLLSFYISF